MATHTTEDDKRPTPLPLFGTRGIVLLYILGTVFIAIAITMVIYPDKRPMALAQPQTGVVKSTPQTTSDGASSGKTSSSVSSTKDKVFVPVEIKGSKNADEDETSPSDEKSDEEKSSSKESEAEKSESSSSETEKAKEAESEDSQSIADKSDQSKAEKAAEDDATVPTDDVSSDGGILEAEVASIASALTLEEPDPMAKDPEPSAAPAEETAPATPESTGDDAEAQPLAESADKPEAAPASVDLTDYENAAADYDYPEGAGVLTKAGGVNWFNGRKETYYSQRVLPGGGLSIPGRHVDHRGIVCDGEGYLCVAASDLPWGTVIETSLGTAKIYDSGCAAGTTDIYVDW